MPCRLLLIDNYDSFTFNLAQLFARFPVKVEVRRNDAISPAEALALAPDALCISPGPGRPGDAGACIDVVRALASAVPVLGVCLGMQVLNEAFGGRTVHAPRPMHGKTSHVIHSGSGVFADIPSPFTAMRYHSLQIDAVPPVFDICAVAGDGVIMDIRHTSWRAYGVQFHPESFRTEFGAELIGNFLAAIDATAAEPRPAVARSLVR